MRRRSTSRGASLTLRGRAVFIAGVVGVVAAYVANINAILFASVLLVAVAVASLLSARHRRPSLSVHRSFGVARAHAGHRVPVGIEVTNRLPRAVGSAVWTDAWARDSGAVRVAASDSGVTVPREFPLLRARSGDRQPSVAVVWDLMPERRGDYRIGPFIVTVTDPFGLATASSTTAHATELTVLPEIVALPEPSLELRRAEGEAHRADHRALGGDHELTTRPYRSGDALRRVHWRASAHHGELMVRQEEQRSAAEASVLLETRATHRADADTARGGAESASFEWAVSMVASLAVHLAETGFRVHVLETAAPQLEGEHSAHLLESLARVRLTEVARPLGPSLVPAGRQGSVRLGTVFAVLGALDDDTITTLVAGRAAYDEAIAFVDGAGHATPATRRLADAGWLCIPVARDATVAEAWAAALERRLR
jgi:uncharacterized protein (DUF58 family)